ncbi:TetR/AcrR family transcriptional regulator [Nocardiopsis sp. ARC36]
MNRVAAHLGVSPMSLYRYVESKDELVQLMADAALGWPDVPDPLTGDWRADLAAWATGASACYRRHPWVTEVPISRLPVLPRNLAWTDYALRVLANTPLTFQDRLSVIALLSGHARNEAATSVQLAQGRTGSGEEGGDAGDAYARTLDAVVGAERFPALRAVVDEHLLVPAPPGEGDAVDTEEVFLFGLERILDGIAVLVERRRRTAERRTPMADGPAVLPGTARAGAPRGIPATPPGAGRGARAPRPFRCSRAPGRPRRPRRADAAPPTGVRPPR